MQMTEVGMLKLNTMINREMIPLIENMISTKNLPAKFIKLIVGTWFVHIELLVDRLGTDMISRVVLRLDSNILFNPDYCSEIDHNAKIVDKFSLEDRVKLRILWIVFSSCVAVSKSLLSDSTYLKNPIRVKFEDRNGFLVYGADY